MSDQRGDRFESRSARTAELIQAMLVVVQELEQLHPGRKFSLDGHLVGAIGEAAAEAMFEIGLVPPSTAGFDALTADGRTVEIKATFGGAGVGVRAQSHDAAHLLIVLRLSKEPEEEHEVVFNGPLLAVVEALGPLGSNGQARVGLRRLRQLDAAVAASDRVPRRNAGSARRS